MGSDSAATDRLRELLECATRVFIAQGYRRTQMADVAAALGVAKGTLYLYVASKEALFYAALLHADPREPVGLPTSRPIRTPDPDEVLCSIKRRLEEEGEVPALSAALERVRVTNVRAELEAIVRGLYRMAFRGRVALKLLDRCAHDYPDLAKVFYETGRMRQLGQLEAYLESRISRHRLRAFPDVRLAARGVAELIVFWAVHRHWDPAPQVFNEAHVEDMVVEMVLGFLLEE